MNNNASPDILIVDDDHEIRTLLSRYLEEQGFRVSTAGDLRGCNEAMSRRTPICWFSTSCCRMALGSTFAAISGADGRGCR